MGIEKKTIRPTFLELATPEEASRVNLDDYVFLERLSATRGLWCFKVRQR